MHSLDLRGELVSRLPTHLRERVHVVSPQPPGPASQDLTTSGEFILYWMRTAVRGHENPALDVALSLSALLSRPLFVYHAVSERYPYASDRHHHFILEGARDVQVELASRGIGYALHVERRGHRGPHLRRLAERAVIVVTEDMPWAPLVAWTQGLATALRRPLLAVDTACVLPARLIGRAWLRAFAFRAATASERRQRAHKPWTEVTPAYPAFVPSLPFQPLDLATVDLAELVAGCDIDHSIAPVPHTRGGSQAGYARWARFVRQGLSRYASGRDDPLQPEASSRMSAYLHYGQVSPLRIAREAVQAAVAEDSRDKFLDELLTWRELAHVYCTYEPGHETLAAVPDWAKKTLAAHESDRRPLLPSWERLARGETGEPLWDAAQHSLRIHGELHNNLRMTWGKALLAWTPNAQAALSLLIDLNHRYALDGRDPSSYGGILWCLGQFDRPFPPNRPYLGIVRPRSLREHAKKLSPAAYRAQVLRPALLRPLRVAVLGDDEAVWICARTLADHACPPQVFGLHLESAETASAQQKMQGSVISDPRLRRYVDSWMQEAVISCGAAAGADAESAMTGAASAAPAYLSRGAQGTLIDHLRRGLNPPGTLKQPRLERRGAQWWLHGVWCEAGSLLATPGTWGPFDALLATSAESCTWLQQALTELGLALPTDTARDEEPRWLADLRLGLLHRAAGPAGLQSALLGGMAVAGRVLAAFSGGDP